MYHVSAQGVDERMINVHCYYYTAPSEHPQKCLQNIVGCCILPLSLFTDIYL